MLCSKKCPMADRYNAHLYTHICVSRMVCNWSASLSTLVDMFPAAWAFRHSMLSHVPRCMSLPSHNVVPCPPLHEPSVTQCCPMFPAAWAFRHSMLSHVPRCMSLPSLNVVPCSPLHGPSVTQCCPMFPAA